MDFNTDTEAGNILEAGKQLATGKVIASPHAAGIPMIMVPTGVELQEIPHPIQPVRKLGIVSLDDTASFIDYFNKQGEGAKRIYASLEPVNFVGLLNDHSENPGEPDWRDFGCQYTPKHSKEWIVWTHRNKQPFDGNEAFAIWLEDNLLDVITPSNGQLMEIALNFRVINNAAFSNPVRLQDGNQELTYTSTVEGSTQVAGTGKVRIPELFTVEIPVFQGREAPKYKMDARFRFRLTNGALKLWYELVRPHKVLEQAFNDMVDKIATDTKQTVLYGSHVAK